MDTTSLAALIIAVLGSLIPALITWLRASNREARAAARRLQVLHDERDERVMRHRAAIRLHNDQHHPTGVDAAPLPELPEHMTRTDDDE